MKKKVVKIQRAKKQVFVTDGWRAMRKQALTHFIALLGVWIVMPFIIYLLCRYVSVPIYNISNKYQDVVNMGNVFAFAIWILAFITGFTLYRYRLSFKRNDMFATIIILGVLILFSAPGMLLLASWFVVNKWMSSNTIMYFSTIFYPGVSYLLMLISFLLLCLNKKLNLFKVLKGSIHIGGGAPILAALIELTIYCTTNKVYFISDPLFYRLITLFLLIGTYLTTYVIVGLKGIYKLPKKDIAGNIMWITFETLTIGVSIIGVVAIIVVAVTAFTLAGKLAAGNVMFSGLDKPTQSASTKPTYEYCDENGKKYTQIVDGILEDDMGNRYRSIGGGEYEKV